MILRVLDILDVEGDLRALASITFFAFPPNTIDDVGIQHEHILIEVLLID